MDNGKSSKRGRFGRVGIKKSLLDLFMWPCVICLLSSNKTSAFEYCNEAHIEQSGHLEQHHVPVTVFVCLIFPFSNESILNTLADKHSEIPWHHPNNVEYGDVASLLCYYHY